MYIKTKRAKIIDASFVIHVYKKGCRITTKTQVVNLRGQRNVLILNGRNDYC